MVRFIANFIHYIKFIVERRKDVARYNVEFKAKKTGEWYIKTNTDYINSAYSVAYTQSYGKDYRIVDTETGIVIQQRLTEDNS